MVKYYFKIRSLVSVNDVDSLWYVVVAWQWHIFLRKEKKLNKNVTSEYSRIVRQFGICYGRKWTVS